MKNTIFKTVLVLLVCLAMVASVACGKQEAPKPADDPKTDTQGTTNNDTTEPAKTGNDAPSVDVPTEDGKVTFYFTLGEGSVEQPAIASYFLTGGSFNWATGMESLQFTQLNDTNVYYAITDVIPNPDADKGLDYQLKVGYNETSGAPASELGLTWADDELKSDVCNMGGGENPKFEWTAGQATVNLGVHTFGKAMPLPQTANTTLVITFAEPLPEGCEARIYGGFNGWSAADDATCKFTISEDRLRGELKLENVLLNTYAYKVVVYGPDQFDGGAGQWLGMVFVDNAVDGDGNGAFTIGTLDDGDYIEVVNDIKYEQTEGMSVTLRVTFDKALEEGSIVHIYGAFQGWGYAEGKCEMTSEDNISWTYTIESITPGEQQFKVLVYAPGTTEFGWGLGTEYGNNGENCVVVITEADAGQIVDAASFTVAE